MELYAFDESYVRRLLGGDAAIEQHFVSYFGRLLRLKLRARGLPSDVVDDLCQETFIRVLTILKREGALHSPERLGAFVHSVCTNILLEHYRGNSRVQSLEETAEPEDGSIGLDEALVSVEAQAMVRRILSGLPERDRTILSALFLEEKSKDQVCRELSVDRNYLRVLLHRAKKQFRESLSTSGVTVSQKT